MQRGEMSNEPTNPENLDQRLRENFGPLGYTVNADERTIFHTATNACFRIEEGDVLSVVDDRSCARSSPQEPRKPCGESEGEIQGSWAATSITRSAKTGNIADLS
jgi:hypothetical protein